MELQQLRVVIHGAVQGVWFRPFVYRLATEMQLHRCVSNTSLGAIVEVDGSIESGVAVSTVEEDSVGESVAE